MLQSFIMVLLSVCFLSVVAVVVVNVVVVVVVVFIVLWKVIGIYGFGIISI